jgi:hypothetical protein
MMQEHKDSPGEPSDDGNLVESLSMLRRLEPPLTSRIANRAVVIAELKAMEAAVVMQTLPWWRRSIAVPVPLAASLLAIVVIGVPLITSAWSDARRADAPIAPLTVAKKQPGYLSERAPVASAPLKTAPRQTAAIARDYFVTETYLCGVGRVRSHSRYSNPENSP